MDRKYQFNLNKRAYSLSALLVIVISFVFIQSTFKQIIFASGADEGYYFRYATHIADNGLAALKGLFKEYVGNKAHWRYPNPLRIGFIVISALWLRITGYSFLGLSYLSLLSYCIFLFCVFNFTKKYFNEKIALFSTILLAVSPLQMAMARRALMDATSNLFTFLSLWLFFESVKENKSKKLWLFVFVYSFNILIRENSVLLSLFFFVYLLIQRKKGYLRSQLMHFLSISVFPLSFVVSAYFFASGNINYIIEIVKIILKSPSTNQYAILFCSGPWYRYLIDFMLLSPWVILLFIGNVFSNLINHEKHDTVDYLIAFSIISFIVFNMFIKNVRYVIFLDAPMRILAAVFLYNLSEKLFKKYAGAITLSLIIVISIYDLSNFYYLFVSQGIYDPVSNWLLQAQHIIPWR